MLVYHCEYNLWVLVCASVNLNFGCPARNFVVCFWHITLLEQLNIDLWLGYWFGAPTPLAILAYI